MTRACVLRRRGTAPDRWAGRASQRSAVSVRKDGRYSSGAKGARWVDGQSQRVDPYSGVRDHRRHPLVGRGLRTPSRSGDAVEVEAAANREEASEARGAQGETRGPPGASSGLPLGHPSSRHVRATRPGQQTVRTFADGVDCGCTSVKVRLAAIPTRKRARPMKTSDAERYEYVCPVCGGPVSNDASGKGYVRHLHRRSDGTVCPSGRGDRDGPQRDA